MGYREDYGLSTPELTTYECTVRVDGCEMIHTVTTTSYSPMRVAQLELESELGVPLQDIMAVTYREIP